MKNCLAHWFGLLKCAVLTVLVLAVIGLARVPGWTGTHPETPATEVAEISFKSLPDGSEMVSIHLDGFHAPEIFSMNSEFPRVVCDFPELRLSPSVLSRYEFSGSLLRSVRVARHRSPDPKVRVVLDLVRDVSIDVSPFFFQKERIFALTLQQSGTTEP
ncbi:MAG TPA: AMIN domain-containing protein [Desulfomicrobiaceae bacterium]|nr:AMIN domain-containing protein [Desulfomicrobiaceae bacterium]